jgi:transcriptional antiterminator NusG
MSDTENIENNTIETAGLETPENVDDILAAAGVLPAEEKSSLADLQGEWYVLQVFTGFEKKVCATIEQKVNDFNLQDRIFKVLVPEEDVVEIKNSKRFERKKMMFPGYVFVNMKKDDEAWYHIRAVNGVSKGLGAGTPEPLPEKEVVRILNQTGETAVKPKLEIDFEVGENVKVISGPFRGYAGEIKAVLADKGKVQIMISVFGRSTPMELDFNQIEKNV